jgi:hypothetical protein
MFDVERSMRNKVLEVGAFSTPWRMANSSGGVDASRQ